MQKRAWLRCEIFPGMFSTELAIQITTMDGHLLSFFLPKDSVRELDSTIGEIEVELIEEGPDFGFVLLQFTESPGSVNRVPESAT